MPAGLLDQARAGFYVSGIPAHRKRIGGAGHRHGKRFCGWGRFSSTRTSASRRSTAASTFPA
eukprot:9402194-Alexandrium_andersonii.AAC.1